MKVVRIYPKFGIRNLLPSDTLWGNIIFSIKRLYGDRELKQLLEQFLTDKPPFILSSCFPFLINEGNNIEYYFPLPLVTLSTEIETTITDSVEKMIYFKEFKKIKLIEKSYFEKMLSEGLSIKDLFQEFLDYKKNREVRFKYFEEPKKTYTLHNQIDRWYSKTVETDEGGALYWDEEFVFKKNQSGLFFLVEGDLNFIIPALRFLSDVGIAGNNSIGKGKFLFEIDDLTFSTPKNPNSQIILSLFSPNQDDLKEIERLNNNLWYELTIRKGYSGIDFNITPQEKNAVIVFSEGSVFFTTKKLKGSLIKTGEINQDYIIFNCYHGFSLPSYFKVEV